MTAEMSYLAVDPRCGHAVGAAVLVTRHLGDVAREVKRWQRAGLEVKLVTVEEVREAEWCECTCPRRAERAKRGKKAEV